MATTRFAERPTLPPNTLGFRLGDVVYTRDTRLFYRVRRNVGDTDTEFVLYGTGFDASILSTRGDLLVRGIASLLRLPLGAVGHVLTSNGTDALWIAPTGLAYPPHYIPLLGAASRVELTAATLMGGSPGAVDPAALARPGLTLTYTLVLTGAVSAPGLTGEVTLVDSAAATVATINVVATTPTHYTAAVTVPGVARSYELRARLTTSSGPADYLTLTSAALRVAWS